MVMLGPNGSDFTGNVIVDKLVAVLDTANPKQAQEQY